MLSFILLAVVVIQLHRVAGLTIASYPLWIERTPQPYAIENFYNGSTPAILISGGVPDILSNQSVDLSANAETPSIRQYVDHRNIRLIYVICEVSYRLVADRRKGINKLEDLKGKRIGSFLGSSAEVFVHNMMSSVGVKDHEYEGVNAWWCMKTPCANDTLPYLLNNGSLDAFGIWETSVELGARALGDDAIIFQNASIYREVYALFSTTEALDNPSRRKDIVEFVRALDKTREVFTNTPKEKNVFEYVAKTVDADVEVVEAVWKHHNWSGRWDDGMIDFLVEEDGYLAKQDNRTVTPREELEKMLDSSVIDEL